MHLVEPSVAYGRAEIDWQGIHSRGYSNWLQETVKPLEDVSCTARVMAAVFNPHEVAVMARGEGDCIIVKGDHSSLQVLRGSLQPIQWDLTDDMKLAWMDHVKKFAAWAQLKGASVMLTPDSEAMKLAKERDELRNELEQLKRRMGNVSDMVTPPPAQRTPTPYPGAMQKGGEDLHQEQQDGGSFVSAASLLADKKGNASPGWRKVTSKMDDTPGSWSTSKTKRTTKEHKLKRVVKTKERRLVRAGEQPQDSDVDMLEEDDKKQGKTGDPTQAWAPPEESQN